MKLSGPSGPTVRLAECRDCRGLGTLAEPRRLNAGRTRWRLIPCTGCDASGREPLEENGEYVDRALSPLRVVPRYTGITLT